MWLEFVIGSRPCSAVFSPGSSAFLSPQKTTLRSRARTLYNELKALLSYVGKQIIFTFFYISAAQYSRLATIYNVLLSGVAFFRPELLAKKERHQNSSFLRNGGMWRSLHLRYTIGINKNILDINK